ncbi:MAG: polysaccharide biosynthesis tyrosine autokinase [Bacteroidota bacterium]
MIKKQGFIINKQFDGLIAQTIITRYWWYPIVLVTLFCSVAYIYIRYTKPTFESTAIIQIDEQDNAKDIIEVENLNTKDQDMFAMVELMRSQLIFEQAISQINYNVSHFSKGQLLTEEKYNSSTFNVQPYSLKDSSLIGVPIFVSYNNAGISLNYSLYGKNYSRSGKLNEHIVNDHFDLIVKCSSEAAFRDDGEQNELYFVFNNLQDYAARLLPNLLVVPVDNVAKTIQVSFRGTNPRLCKDVVEAVTTTFFAYNDGVKRKGSEKILAFIDQQLDSLVGELRNSKDSVMTYQRKSNLPDPEMATQSLSGKINTYQDQIFLLQDEIRSLRNVDAKLKSDPNRLDVYRLLPEMLGKSYEQALSNQINQLHELLEKKEDLMFRVTEENSEVITINQKIQSKLSSVRKSIAAIIDRLSSTLSLINADMNGLEGEFFDLPEKKMELSRLRNIQELNEKYFSLLTEKKVQYSISDAGFASNNRVLTRAVEVPSPIAPNTKTIYTLFAVFGIFIGLALIVFRYLRYNEINQVEDLQNLLPERATILGVVPLIQAISEYSQLVVNDSPKSAISELMRRIRTNLSYIHPEYQTIAISSSISGEGKTFVALNLAGIIAMSGKRTILLDLDMRRPKVHHGLGATNENGMSRLIVGQTSFEEVIKKSKLENLDFITAGPIPPNPSELLLSDSFKNIITDLKTRYDVIIIDNPPIGLVSDGVRMLSDSDIPIYVFKAQYSKRNFIYRVRELFEMKQISNLNVILNGLKSSRFDSYGYGYSYEYYEENFIDGNFFTRFIKKLFKKVKRK